MSQILPSGPKPTKETYLSNLRSVKEKDEVTKGSATAEWRSKSSKTGFAGEDEIHDTIGFEDEEEEPDNSSPLGMLFGSLKFGNQQPGSTNNDAGASEQHTVENTSLAAASIKKKTSFKATSITSEFGRKASARFSVVSQKIPNVKLDQSVKEQIAKELQAINCWSDDEHDDDDLHLGELDYEPPTGDVKQQKQVSILTNASVLRTFTGVAADQGESANKKEDAHHRSDVATAPNSTLAVSYLPEPSQKIVSFAAAASQPVPPTSVALPAPTAGSSRKVSMAVTTGSRKFSVLGSGSGSGGGVNTGALTPQPPVSSISTSARRMSKAETSQRIKHAYLEKQLEMQRLEEHNKFIKKAVKIIVRTREEEILFKRRAAELQRQREFRLAIITRYATARVGRIFVAAFSTAKEWYVTFDVVDVYV
jgi:hypothetical protein